MGVDQLVSGGDVDNPVYESLEAERINKNYYTSRFSGSSPDDRLDNALSAVSNGDTIVLETGNFDKDRTITQNIRLKSQGNRWTDNATINGTWTITGRTLFVGGFLDAGELIFQSKRNIIREVNAGKITVDAGSNLLSMLNAASVTFKSGTNRNVIDSCTQTSVTDNGTNTVGVII